ncbi:hypothetical protein K7432_012810, partial [Basidiobolus ranarum]
MVKKRLPSYMVPTIWVPLNRLPTTSSEKIDRRFLVSFYETISKEELKALNASDSNSYVAARTPDERVWASLWSSLLNIPETSIGIHDSFFSLGGDSILAIRLVGAAHQVGLGLTVQDLYEHPTIAEIADASVVLDSDYKTIKSIERYSLLGLNEDELQHIFHQDLTSNSIELSQVEDIYPCSPLQEALIALGLKDDSSYLTQQVYRCQSSLDIDRFKSAWQAVVCVNPILRTTILFSTAGYQHLSGLQIVKCAEGIEWNEYELSDDDSMEEQLQQALEQDQSRGIVAGGPLTRFTLLTICGSAAYFIWTIHHSLYDGWSIGHIVDDLLVAYQNQALATRPSYNLYIDYIRSLDKNKSLDYWKTNLGDANPTHLARTVSIPGEIQISATVIEKFQADFSALTGAHDFTIATIANLAWAMVLKSHTGNSDVLFGIVNSGRNIPLKNIHNICGPCINTIPTRVTLSDDLSLLDSLKVIHLAQMEQYQHQSIGLQEISKHCCNEDAHSLFDSLLVIQNLTQVDSANSFGSIGLEEVNTTMPVDYPIVVELSSSATDHQLTLTYDAKIVTKDEACWTLNHFKVAMTEILRNIHALVKDVSVMSSQEASLIQSWSGIDNVPMEPTCIHSMFEQTALLHPENIAVQFETSEYVTYCDLNRRANQLAHHLIHLGVRPESMVPLCLDKSVFMIVAMLAVLKAGGAYVPLDPNNPPERNLFILNETKAQVVLTIDQYKHNFDTQSVVLLDSHAEAVSQNSTENPRVSELTASNLCYVLYTSGSTGTPKGVMMEHSPAVHFIHALRDVWDLSTHDSVLQFANYTFDASVIEIFCSLAVGVCVALAPKESLLSDLEGCIRTMNVTSLMLTPTIATYINPRKVPSVKRLILGGEMITTTARNIWSPYVEISNAYGPTEAAVAFLANTQLDDNMACSNVGKPIGSNRIYITDVDMHPVPLGVVGELCVAGPQLARGYLNRPDLTAKAFVDSPSIAEERLYRTGDLARFNADGSVELIGRKDNQIKLHGLRIELDEIEHALYDHSQVTRACVLPLVTDQATNRKSLVAFLTCCEVNDNCLTLDLLSASQMAEAGSCIEDLKTLVRKRLPSYMIPNVWLPLNRMPINTSGKVDRNKLANFFASLNFEEVIGLSNNTNEVNTSPSTPMEKVIQNIWSDTLNIPAAKISIDDSFYQLGGDSISAIRVSSLSRQNGVSLSVKQIMQNPTIRTQALVANSTDITCLELVQINEGDILLTPIQRYFLETPQVNMHHFNQSWLLKLRDPTTSDSLTGAIAALIQQHELLRGRFFYSENQWQLRVLPIDRVAFEVHQHSVESISELKDHVHQLQQSLNILTGPLFQFSLYDLCDGQQLIFMTVHHYIIDLVSWRIIWEDLEQLLQGKECGYKSMAFMQWSSLLDEHAQELDMNMWPQQATRPIIDDMALLAKNTISTAKSLSFALTSYETEQLFGKSNSPFQTEATDFMISSLAIAYCSVFNLSNMTIGMEGHGREAWKEGIDISRTVGWFTTIYPFLVEVEGANDPLSVLKRVKDLRKLTPDNGIVYGLLRHLSRRSENPFNQDVIQISFNYLGRFQQLENENSFLQSVEAPFDFDLGEASTEWRRNHVFDISASVNQNCFQAEITFSTALHSEDIVAQWLHGWKETLTAMINNCAQLDIVERTRSDFPLLKLSESEFDLLYKEILPEAGVDSNFIEDILPCTHLQEGLIVGMLKSADFYHVQHMFALAGDFDYKKFQCAWLTVIEDHPMLRTVFVQNSTIEMSFITFFQVTIESYTPQWTHIVCPENSFDKTVSEYLTADKANSFDLGQPNMRFALMETDTNKRMLIISWHHGILDASSWSLVLEDVYAVYHQQPRPKTYPFRDFVASLCNRKPTYVAEEKAFWQSRFSQLSTMPFPKLGVSEESEAEMIRIPGTIDIPIHNIVQFAQHSKVTIFTLIKATWALLLKIYTQSEDVVFGYMVNGRNSDLEGVSSMIGPCINTLPCRIRYEGQMTVCEWLHIVHTGYTASLSYQQSSLRDIQSWAGMSPLFDTLIDYKNVSIPQIKESLENSKNSGVRQLSFKQLEGDEIIEYPLGLSVEANTHELSYNVVATKKLTSTLHAELIARDFKAIFEELVSTTVDKKLEHLGIALSNTYMPKNNYSSVTNTEVEGICIHHTFEDQVKLHPENIAVQFETS